MPHEPAVCWFPDVMVKSEPTELHPEELKREAKTKFVFRTSTDRTTMCAMKPCFRKFRGFI